MVVRSLIRTFASQMQDLSTLHLADSVGSTAVTIGFFDGVHSGHRALIGQLCEEARRRNLTTTVITFDRHPRMVLQPQWRPQLLSTLSEKRELLSQTGIDRVEVLHFDRQMANLTARQFMDEVLVRQMGARMLLTGYDNHFGKRSEDSPREGFDDYVGYGRELGIEVVAGRPYEQDGMRVSSSFVRQLLLDGKVEQAASCLGRPYQVCGEVVHGEAVGRRIGFPTANLLPPVSEDEQKLMPGTGVYAVWVRVGTESELHPGMMNIGRRPTFGGEKLTYEVHLLHFSGSLYGQTINVYFVQRLRDERPFASVSELTRQMEADCQRATDVLSNPNNRSNAIE